MGDGELERGEIERRLWEILWRESGGERRMVKLTEYGVRELPAHKEELTHIIAHWRNRGFVITNQADTRAMLTATGQQKRGLYHDRRH